MRWMIRAWTLALCLWTVPGHAAVLDPGASTSLGVLNTTQPVSINTDTLALTGVLDPITRTNPVTFDTISGADISIIGARPVSLLSKGNITLTGGLNVLGRGGLDIVATRSLTVGGGRNVSLAVGQVNLAGSARAVIRPLAVMSGAEVIALSGEIGNGIISISGRNDFIATPGAGISGRTVNLSSGAITLTGGTITGQVANRAILSPTVSLSGSPGVVVVAPVPVPAPLLLFASGLVPLAIVKRRKS